MNTDGFVNSVIGVVIGVIVCVSIAVPIISGLTLGTDDTFANKGIVNTLIAIVPVLLLVALVVGAVAIIKAKKQ